MLARDNLITIAPSPVTNISSIIPRDVIGSIFLIKSVLLALVKEGKPISTETEIKISGIRKEIFHLDKKEEISDIDFINIDTQFYLALSQHTELQGVNQFILNEKLHIDRVLRLFLKHTKDYKSIIKLYEDILSNIQSNNTTSASTGICDLAKTLEAYTSEAAKYCNE